MRVRKVWVWGGGGEDLGGVKEEENIIRIYSMKKKSVFDLKKREKNPVL